MPRGDKTGPMEDGSLTGRRLGPCYDGSDLRDRRSVGRGLGRGRGFGRARGLGRGYGDNQGKQTSSKSRK